MTGSHTDRPAEPTRWPNQLRRLASEPQPLSLAFHPRANSFGFLRWLFAALVILDHSYPLGGFGDDALRHWSQGQDTLGGLSVAGFFVISGFLITRSWLHTGSTVRYLWHRFLRIFPGYWVCLLVTGFILAPLAWHHEHGGAFAVYSAGPVRPWAYFTSNLWLTIHHYGIADLLRDTPFGRRSGGAWDGSLWTLIYEFRCYLLIAVFGLTGVLTRYRGLVLAATAALYVATVSALVDPSWQARVVPVLADVYVARFTFLFLLGSLLCLYADRVPIDDRLAVLATVVAVVSLHRGGWFLLGYPALAYLTLVLAVRLPLRWFGRRNDLSYGIYIYAFPIQQLLAQHGLQRHGGPALFAGVSLVLTSIVAFVSWRVVEKPALRCKDWTPGRPQRPPRTAARPSRDRQPVAN